VDCESCSTMLKMFSFNLMLVKLDKLGVFTHVPTPYMKKSMKYQMHCMKRWENSTGKLAFCKAVECITQTEVPKTQLCWLVGRE
jgi:hypothetical protein